MTFCSLQCILMTFLVIMFMCCVITPLLLSPSLTALRNSTLEHTGGSATLEKLEVAEQHSGVLRLTLTTACNMFSAIEECKLDISSTASSFIILSSHENDISFEMAYYVSTRTLNSAQSLFELTGQNIIACPRKHL